MPDSQSLRLQRIEVDRLFGIYDHKINLNLEDRVTLLHAPNGVGKTIVLRMIDSILKERFRYLATIPFHRLLLGFDDGSTLELAGHKLSNVENDEYKLVLTSPAETHSSIFNLKLQKTASVFAPPRNFPIALAGHGGSLFPSSEKLLGTSNYWLVPEDQEKIPWLSAFLENAKSHLIETQRLVRIDEESEEPSSKLFGIPQPPSPTAAVIELAQHFRKRLDDTMAQYGRQSQTLDQSFPQRLINATESLPEEELQFKMSALDEKTAGLISIGILDKTQTTPFQIEDFKKIYRTEARVMTLYVQDTERKLQVLEDLANRTRLLLENVNQKFRYKRIKLDRESGFVATGDMGQIPLSSLSSGEQHELVLNYDLLFRVPTNTIVLIDEPELSLHVTWQKRFLPDLISIVKLRGLDALVATHSPFIVGDNTELMVGLGDSV